MTSPPDGLPTDLAPPDDLLRALAEAHGISLGYWDWRGQHVTVSAGAVRALLAALGVDASTPEEVGAALEARELAPWRRMLPPTVVTREGEPRDVPVHVSHGSPVEVWVELEDGGRADVEPRDVWVPPRQVGPELVGRATVALPGTLPPGWHTLKARSGDREASGVLVVSPRRLPEPLHGSRVWGLMVQLYQVRSERSWGIGDLGDLADLTDWSARELGAGFVLVNPLHAVEPTVPQTASPYLPTSRRYANPQYLDLEAIPEFAELTPTALSQVEALAQPIRAQQRDGALLDRDSAWLAKRAALELIHALPLTAERAGSLTRYQEREGQGLLDFATWCALAEEHGPSSDAWPAELADAHGDGARRARDQHQGRVGFHIWLQWLMSEQLEDAQRRALAAGMPIGVVHDLAVGVHPRGADAWALRDVLANGCSVGAPPDPFNQLGQNWSQPPWHPDRLAEAGYAPFRDLVRSVLRHAGGVRIDHVIGLFRLWWVPNGQAASAGAYVRYDHDAMIGILLLEAQRAGAVVIGEDLGVVEPWVRDYLADRGVLGTSISWFEKGWSNEPLAPEHWRVACLATVTTHDLPPTAGYLRGEHLDVRERLGLLTRSIEEERAADEGERSAVLESLHAAGVLDPAVTLDSVLSDEDSLSAAVIALHAQLSRTPSRLLGVSLADVVGDRRAVNQPGTDEEYPNWRVPLTDARGRAVLLEDLMAGDSATLAHRLAVVLGTRSAQ